MRTLLSTLVMTLAAGAATAPALSAAESPESGWLLRAFHGQPPTAGAAHRPKPPVCRGWRPARAQERALLSKVRRARAVRRRGAVGTNRRLQRAARGHSVRLVTRGTFEHSARIPYHRVRAGAQNLARARSARQALRLMLRSRPHRRTLLDRRWALIGVGAATDCSGLVTYTVNFVARARRR